MWPPNPNHKSCSCVGIQRTCDHQNLQQAGRALYQPIHWNWNVSKRKNRNSINPNEETLIAENPTESEALSTPNQLKNAEKELSKIRWELKAQVAITSGLFRRIQDNLLDQLDVEDKSELNDYLGFEWPQVQFG
ncbi:hypothetical protein TRICI_002082 [Trichomonascus ciferrii]|uniref:Uncharacterized protein n=1 Tax=Trichomonascus ciferrii TaxID=44093 RepID=A0A642V903_9ASCO|nr:hypothetical protein TRICI_002082 [Trichomonascus ciferrii]